jgi:hypothetical protein
LDSPPPPSRDCALWLVLRLLEQARFWSSSIYGWALALFTLSIGLGS